MTLQNWLNNGWLREHVANGQEVRDLLQKIDRDIADAAITEVSLDWRLTMADFAGIGCATTALRVCGYRIPGGAGNHQRTIQSLRYTLNPDKDIIISLEAISKKRSIVNYDTAGTITEAELNEAISLAKELRELLYHWLRGTHPKFTL
ncbi:MAG: hypothetical protein R3F48_02230 [Candidatus Zixiibacteriota bacterium]